MDPVEKKDIYQEYVSDIIDVYKHDKSLGYEAWLKLWNMAFEHVRIREYKAVTGKCLTCAILSDLRRTRKDSGGRKQTTTLQAYHRSAFMGERETYYDRQREALDDPENIMSIIIDGKLSYY